MVLKSVVVTSKSRRFWPVIKRRIQCWCVVLSGAQGVARFWDPASTQLENREKLKHSYNSHILPENRTIQFLFNNFVCYIFLS